MLPVACPGAFLHLQGILFMLLIKIVEKVEN